MTRAVFLDRDGVINRKPPEGLYITSWADFKILPGVVEGIRLLNRAAFAVIVVTNQRSIAKGLMTIEELEEMHVRMSDLLESAGATIDGVYYCPHEMEPPCDCRKPAPGMLIEAARSREIDLPTSWMVGDSDIDIEAGRNAGCKTARLVASSEAIGAKMSKPTPPIVPDIIAPSLLDAIHQILHWDAAATGSFTTDLAAT
jgi:D-glycero-D-manno-heptose 1,7-bisphosphate phosphatase